MLFARASLKPGSPEGTYGPITLLSRAFCAGLIEAGAGGRQGDTQEPRYPVLFARASLKLLLLRKKKHMLPGLSRAFCAGLIEASIPLSPCPSIPGLSRAFCAGLIEADRTKDHLCVKQEVIPCFLRGPH